MLKAQTDFEIFRWTIFSIPRQQKAPLSFGNIDNTIYSQQGEASNKLVKLKRCDTSGYFNSDF